jgi:hypothetical protein
MTPLDLKRRLAGLGAYDGVLDDSFDAVLRTAILRAMEEGPDYRLTEADFAEAAGRLGCDVAAIRAVRRVEASANPFVSGKPTILFEPHRFSRATGHRFDASHPALSSRTWNRRLYPATQAGRWAQLLGAAALDIDAAFASASYGAFQILGENFAVCGARDAFAFAWQEAQTEADQLAHFCAFVEGTGLAGALRRHDWAKFARGYNGTAYRENRYDERLAAAHRKELAA